MEKDQTQNTYFYMFRFFFFYVYEWERMHDVISKISNMKLNSLLIFKENALRTCKSSKIFIEVAAVLYLIWNQKFEWVKNFLFLKKKKKNK